MLMKWYKNVRKFLPEKVRCFFFARWLGNGRREQDRVRMGVPATGKTVGGGGGEVSSYVPLRFVQEHRPQFLLYGCEEARTQK